ncbi:MAG TPA: MoxR family ATPase [Terriglobales bacterium]|nr:MoxR family ATPase [Terriglobales bacterium]
MLIATSGRSIAHLESALRAVVRNTGEAVRMALIAVLANGHLLIEDVPGVGKTTLAQAMARSMDCSLQRVQFTSDLLPSDVVGISIYDQANERFEFKRGPIFAHVVLADEINRTTPKTQSALLEAMNERQVTIDGKTYPLPSPFLVIATQNPTEHQGTYPLPESQLDRFLLRIRMGYPNPADEKAILQGEAGAELLGTLRPVLTIDEVLQLQQQARTITVEDSLLEYELALVRATRQHPMLALGVSPRGSMMLHRAAQARALIEGRSYCTPEDFKRLFVPVCSHRVLLRPALAHLERSVEQAESVLEEIARRVPVPA